MTRNESLREWGRERGGEGREKGERLSEQFKVSKYEFVTLKTNTHESKNLTIKLQSLKLVQKSSKKSTNSFAQFVANQ